MTQRFRPHPVFSSPSNDTRLAARDHPEPPVWNLTPFELDRHRIIESTAFRRLQRKTQVFAPAAGDHYRTRLTHTLEVAHIARILARALGADVELAEAIALAHDLGHAPFGHAGEKALDSLMAGSGGFNHNFHALRVVEFLEHPCPAYRGLNLTAATRIGLLEHETLYDEPAEAAEGGPRRSLEGQIASLADRLAYDCHDIEDAIGARFVNWSDLGRLELWAGAVESTGVDATGPIFAVRRVVIDAVFNRLIGDVIETTRIMLADAGDPPNVAAVDGPAVRCSPTAERALREVEEFLFHTMYRRAEVVESDRIGQQKIAALFDCFREDPGLLPMRFRQRVEEQGAERVVCDYIAGMTDRFCEQQYAVLTGHAD